MDHVVTSGPRGNEAKGTSSLRPKRANRAHTCESHPGQEHLPAPPKGDAASASLPLSSTNAGQSGLPHSPLRQLCWFSLCRCERAPENIRCYEISQTYSRYVHIAEPGPRRGARGVAVQRTLRSSSAGRAPQQPARRPRSSDRIELSSSIIMLQT